MKIVGAGNNRIQIATPNDSKLNVEIDSENNENHTIASVQQFDREQRKEVSI